MSAQNDPYPCFRCSPWNQEDLLAIYRKEVVPAIISQGWAIDEMNCDHDLDHLIEEIWKGYERWAEERIEEEKIQQLRIK